MKHHLNDLELSFFVMATLKMFVIHLRTVKLVVVVDILISCFIKHEIKMSTTTCDGKEITKTV